VIGTDYIGRCKSNYSSPPLINPTLLHLKDGLIRGLASLDGDNLVVFYYHSVSEIWSDKRVVLWWERPYKQGNYCAI